MRRDFELIRVILLRIEQWDFETSEQEFQIVEFDQKSISYHVHLLWDGGFVDGIEASTLSDPYGVVVTGLPWKGHDFLDSIRDATVWEKTKALVTSKGLQLTFEAIKLAAPLALKAMFGDPK